MAGDLPEHARSAKHILFHVLKELVRFKKLNQGGGVRMASPPASLV